MFSASFQFIYFLLNFFLQNCNIGEKFISSLLKMSEAFLKMHIHQVINTENWDLLPKDFQTHLLASMLNSLEGRKYFSFFDFYKHSLHSKTSVWLMGMRFALCMYMYKLAN